MVVGTIDIQYMDNKFAEKIGVDAFFEFRLNAYLFSASLRMVGFGVSVKAEIIGELYGSVV